MKKQFSMIKKTPFRLACACLFASSLFLYSCKKGDIGPEGPAGTQGEQGEPGASGMDGKTILSGTSAPSTSLGKEGDFYLNTSTSQLYGPKDAEGWGPSTNLKGATGSTGTPGSTILSGTNTPQNSLGKNGDYYLNKNSGQLYGPKTSSGWGSPITLKGPKGDQGNANVQAKLFNSIDINWQPAVLFGTNYQQATLNVPEITQDIVNHGAVLVYGGFFFAEPWTALPLSFYEAGKTSNFSYGVALNKVVVKLHYTSNAVPSKPGIAFRIVILEGNALLSVKNSGTDLNDYHAVSRFFKWKD